MFYGTFMPRGYARFSLSDQHQTRRAALHQHLQTNVDLRAAGEKGQLFYRKFHHVGALQGLLQAAMQCVLIRPEVRANIGVEADVTARLTNGGHRLKCRSTARLGA